MIEDFQIAEFVSELRSYRFLDLSLFDIALTAIFGILITEQFVPKLHRHRVYWSLLPASIAVHLLFKKETTLTKEFCSRNIWVVGMFIYCLVKTIDN